ncbi:hypothetical protein K439DRAFT_600882 [Ramaria rubella]|nr:hypothetical protein K439DRAFT_600882 [Ramaria rubella]
MPKLSSQVLPDEGGMTGAPSAVPPAPLEHTYTKISDLTDVQILYTYVREVNPSSVGPGYFACKYGGCMYPGAFAEEGEAIRHVRLAHLNERAQAFACITCGTVFIRKQDAVRHVRTMNSGKRFRCANCSKAYSRKDYRDSHQERCFSRTNA